VVVPIACSGPTSTFTGGPTAVRFEVVPAMRVLAVAPRARQCWRRPVPLNNPAVFCVVAGDNGGSRRLREIPSGSLKGRALKATEIERSAE